MKSMRTPCRRVALLPALLAAVCLAQPGAAQAQASTAPAPATAELPPDRLTVADEFLDLRTGPGRGYPQLFSVPRGDWVVIQMRHTDWFQVRSSEGKSGWVHRAQMERTLTEAGQQKTFRDVLLDDFLHRRIEAGAAWGLFKSEPVVKFWGTVRMSETLSAEFTLSQVQGVYSGSTLWHLNVMNEPWADQRISPFFSIGMGRFNNVPNRSLVSNATTYVKQGNVSLGVRYHLSERFVLRVDTTTYTAFLSDSGSGEYRSYTAGLSFFF